MSHRTRENFKYYADLYQEGKLSELVASPDGLLFLLLRSLARKENLVALGNKIAGFDVKMNTKELLEGLYLSPLTLEILKESIKELYSQERAIRKQVEPQLLAELFKLRVFDWGGIRENDINQHLVDNYVKKVVSYDELLSKIDNEILNSVKGFLLCSWYNNWTSILIEDIFKDHHRVLPTVGRIKQVDFLIDDIPFDLKVTYFPDSFLEKQRQIKGIKPKNELAELTKFCKSLNMPIDLNRHPPELKLDIISILSESSQTDIQAYYQKFVQTRQSIINDTIANPRLLLKWLYENQGAQRFDASNRLFIILIDQNKLEESWKLKRDYALLKLEINNYLDNCSFTRNNLLLKWSFNHKNYESYTDVLFVTK